MNDVIASLPEPIGTVYDYEPALRHDRTIYLAGQIAKISQSELHAVGQCGRDIDLDTAMENAGIAARQALAWAATQLSAGERIERILRVKVFISATPDFDGISQIADAASHVFIDALGDAGRHVRSVVGVSRLPRNAPVLLEVTASVDGVDTPET